MKKTVVAAVLRLFGTRTAFVIFLMAFVAFSFFFHRFRFWNVNSRLALTYAIVEDGSLRIDKYVHHPHFETQDRALYNGHYYSDKIIGLSLLAVPPYWALRTLAGLVDRDPKPDFSRHGLTVCIVSFSSALLMVVLLRLLLLLGQSPGPACAAVLFAAFGTMLLPFSSLFYPYLPSLFFLFTALYGIVRETVEPTTAGRGWGSALGVGALVGMAVLCEYTLAVPAGLLSVYYVAFMARRNRMLAYVVACALPLLVFAAYNAACFGNPFSLPYAHLENPEFRAGMSRGFMGLGRFQWYVLLLSTLHPYRGIFFYSPFLLLGGVGAVAGLKRAVPQERALAAMILAVAVYYLVLNASYYMWWGGGTMLSRHLIPMIPFLVLGLAWLPRRLAPLLFALGAVSIVLMLPQSVVEPHFEPFYTNEELYCPWETVQRMGHGLAPPFLRHSLPEFLAGRISINPFNHAIFATDGKGWTLLPLLFAEAVLLFFLRGALRRDRADQGD